MLLCNPISSCTPLSEVTEHHLIHSFTHSAKYLLHAYSGPGNVVNIKDTDLWPHEAYISVNELRIKQVVYIV